MRNTVRVHTTVTHSAMESAKAFDHLTGGTELETELLPSDCLIISNVVLVSWELETHGVEAWRTMGGHQESG